MNPQQQEGIRAVDGPVLLLAGAGSGKTRVITHRIAYLIEERGVSADSILAVTFTNKAAKEMEERVEKILGHSTLAKPTLATFHSFCVRVLRRDIEALRVNGVGLTKTFAIYDEQDQQAVVKAALKRLGIDDKSLKPRVALGRISWAKNHMIDPQEYFLASTNPMEEKIAHIFEIYRKELAKANAMDFDDLLLETVRLLKSSSEVRERYNRRYRYLMIDEYQDTNRPQYELMKLLAGPEKNVCVVGDEDQSIYSWRGADIKNILDFEKDFPNGKTIRLEQNYRSTQVILEGAGAVVSQNTQRKGKNLWTSREGGSLIGYYEAPDGENEALFIADRIKQYLREAGQQADEPRCAVLYRTNSQSRLVEEALRRYQIQYHMVGGFSFYDRAEVKDLLSYLKLVQNPHDSIALQRVVNSPPRGIGKTTMETLERMALSSGMSTWDAMARAMEDRLLPQRTLNSLEGFRRLIGDARAMLGPGFAEKLTEDVNEEIDEDESFDVSGFGTESEETISETAPEIAGENEEFDTSFNFAFDFGPSEEISTIAAENSQGSDAGLGVDSASFNPFAPVALKEEPRKKKTADPSTPLRSAQDDTFVGQGNERPAFRTPGGKATLPELIKFINERSGYIRSLEEEGTPEAFSRIENLKELANAAQDAEERGETLDEFLDHAALASDADQYSAEAKVTLMTLHAAKGLEFPLVFVAGMEEGLFPSARTMMDPSGLEEERRLCYVGMTRAMDTLVMTRARYRRRYGNDMPEQSVPSRFLEEVPSRLVEDLGSPPARPQFSGDYSGLYATPYPKANRFGRNEYEGGERHWSYEDEDQSGKREGSHASTSRKSVPRGQAGGSGSLDNIASFFAGRGQKPAATTGRPKMGVPEPTGKTGFRQGTRVRHPKYGEGTVFRREGDGDDAKITVQFQQHGVKKLVEKFAQLERL
ncbi:ATP-dependent helicase [Edaphobacter albus]|uniref:ATP-dependent helicase n=1 Tax=Edaphobacter sp. 4G125 TaxID=2763071 RepID=UPI001647FF54|nr:UvrD-helicase domain-containing protein [Edaphobacter sp. 4G125]QNI37729.1 UvrD-helicase domain-containing protein [Edaphobacter sp. 4G125]